MITHRRLTRTVVLAVLVLGISLAAVPVILMFQKGKATESTAPAAQGPVSASDNGYSPKGSSASLHASESAFLHENDAAMAKMMDDMSIKPTGDVDRDFVAIMAPHHQGAIDMAKAVLRYGKNEQIRRLAQEIIVTQQQEIAAMRLAIGEPLPPSVASPTTVTNDPASQQAHAHELAGIGHEK